jgi:hypothetical protein
LLLTVSLGLKVLAGAPPAIAAGPEPGARLGQFLTAATGRPAEPVGGGWRIRNSACWLMAFPSGPLGTLDLAARSNAKKADHVAYVHHGLLSAERPSIPFAFEVIAYHLQRPFRAVEPPSYVVLVAPKACGPWPALPWERLA